MLKMSGIKFCKNLKKFVYLDVNLSCLSEAKSILLDLGVKKGFIFLNDNIVGVVDTEGIIRSLNFLDIYAKKSSSEIKGCYNLIGVSINEDKIVSYSKFTGSTLESIYEEIEKEDLTDGIILCNGEVHSILEYGALVETKILSKFI